MLKFCQLLLLFCAVFVKFGNCMEEDYEYDEIRSNITEEELIQILEEMDYVLPDNITREGISDLLDLITNSTASDGKSNTGVLDYDYKSLGGEGIVEDIKDIEISKDLVYHDTDYQDNDVEQNEGESLKKDLEGLKENIVTDDEIDIVWIPVVVEYDYEIVNTMDLVEIFEDDDTQLDYREDENYQKFVKHALDTSVQFESIYQEQRIFNIILLSGVSLICLIVMFGLISLTISIFARSHSPNPGQTDGKVKLVKTGGIVKSYAKIPVEVKNMLPSNVAYKQLYDA
eukprot:GFUD01035276.1.p1 GENE.GFUD01035276.1~~GFUD01035276.1.p1  ORF type:complete len:286 (+),score=89.36 GFUD01035276.1:27-884(+)